MIWELKSKTSRGRRWRRALRAFQRWWDGTGAEPNLALWLWPGEIAAAPFLQDAICDRGVSAKGPVAEPGERASLS
jgi:hypothetical protein